MTEPKENKVAISGTTDLRRLAGAALAGLLLAGATGCGGSEEDTAASAAATAETSESSTSTPVDGPRLVQGGEPGEDAVEVPGDTTLPANAWNHDDVMFMQMMIPHHGQAIEMSELARGRAEDRRVRLLAERISAAQGPEINVMAQWLSERKIEVPRADEEAMDYDHGEHGHSSMAGMLTEEDMDELADADGTAFDRLFLESMIGHHEGALQMADDTAGGGVDVLVGEMRDGVTSSQSAEIARMRALLTEL